MNPITLLASGDTPPVWTGAGVAGGLLLIVGGTLKLLGAFGVSTTKINGRLFKRIEKLETDNDSAKQNLRIAEDALRDARATLRSNDYQFSLLKQEVNDALELAGRQPRYAADGSPILHPLPPIKLSPFKA